MVNVRMALLNHEFVCSFFVGLLGIHVQLRPSDWGWSFWSAWSLQGSAAGASLPPGRFAVFCEP